MPAFSLPRPPRLAYAAASPPWERSPTTPRKREVRGFGSMLEPRYIVRARTVDQCDVSHSFKGGCLLANVLVVFAIGHRFPLSMELGTLADGPGCFPFEHEAYPPHSDCHALE